MRRAGGPIPNRIATSSTIDHHPCVIVSIFKYKNVGFTYCLPNHAPSAFGSRTSPLSTPQKKMNEQLKEKKLY